MKHSFEPGKPPIPVELDVIYRPRLDAAAVQRLRRWHDEAYAELRQACGTSISYLGAQLAVAHDVFSPARASMLLGRAVLTETRAEDRVLDMGTGCGVNAILAARRSWEVVGVDINPHAIACARNNAQRNRVAERTRFFESDLFEQIAGRFDLVLFDPPFRWFKPRDWLEVAIADENYGTLRRFIAQLGDYLHPRGRALIFFGTTGDLVYLRELIASARLCETVVASWSLRRQGQSVDYHVLRLTL